MSKKSKHREGRSAKSLMHTDIKDLKISRKLRELGEIRVNDWELGDVLPAVRELAKREVDVPELLRKTANYRVFEIDFEGKSRKHPKSEGVAKINAAFKQAESFINYLFEKLARGEEKAEIKRVEHRPNHHLVVVVLSHHGASAFIGRGGHTAEAVRSVIQGIGARAGVVFELKVVEANEGKPKKPQAKDKNQSGPTRHRAVKSAFLSTCTPFLA